MDNRKFALQEYILALGIWLKKVALERQSFHSDVWQSELTNL